MAGVSVGPTTGGRHRSLDAEINLVPFIDLLSMCISFLLLTAVWINIGAVQIKQSHGTEAAPTTSQQFEMEIKFANATAIDVQMHRGSAVRKHAVQAHSPEELAKAFDQALKDWEETRDTKLISSVRITPKTVVTYGDLVGLMDVLRKHQIVNLAVLPGGDT